MMLPNAITNTGSPGGCKKLYITHLDTFGPYLKIYGQLNREAVSLVHTRIQQLLPTCCYIEPSWPLARQQAILQIGSFCIYKRVNGAAPADCEFRRARILDVNRADNEAMCVQVEFLDFGYNAKVPSTELLFPKQLQLLQNIPTLCTEYIVLGICTEWKKSEIDQILRIILHQTVDICVKCERNNYKFITMVWKDFNFADYLIHQKKIGAPITTDLLLDHIKKIENQLPSPVINNNSNLNYKPNINNNHYNVAPMSPTEQAREQLAARRSLAARLEQCRQKSSQLVSASVAVPATTGLNMTPMQQALTQQSMYTPIAQRFPHSIGNNVISMLQSNQVYNNRITHTGLPTQQLSPPNLYQRAPLSVTHSYNDTQPPQANPTQICRARYQQPFKQHTPQATVMAPVASNKSNEVSTSMTYLSNNRATFKSSNLTVGSTYNVVISFVENGPCLFSVQLKDDDVKLTKMMERLEAIDLPPLVETPIVGMACLARYTQDLHLYRVLITNVYSTGCKVHYIDYGNFEVVTFNDIYQIRSEFLETKPFSMRFMLSGAKELEPIDLSLKKTFQDMVIYGKFKLKVMPLEGPPTVQYCQLFHEGNNVLEELRQIQKSRLIYPNVEPLNNNDVVEIRYIDSPKNFYVQKVSNINNFQKLMDDMFTYYNKNQKVPDMLHLGTPVIVKFENEWYRAEVMRVDESTIVVRHVDFGYEQRVTKNLISIISSEHLHLPRQAVQCCLKGFENHDVIKDNATTQFEMLAEDSNVKRRSFTVKVFRIQPDGVNIVNLCTKDLNMMKKLYKLSMPFEQYLSMERDEFNSSSNYSSPKKNTNQHTGIINAGSNKASSTTSSNDAVAFLPTNKKAGNVLHSTTLQSDERMQEQQKQKKQQNQAHNHKTAQLNAFINDCDKYSNASSKDNRDSHSSSSELKQLQSGKRQQHQQQNAKGSGKSQLDISVERRSNGSGGSIASGTSSNKKQRNQGGQVPARFQNGNKTQQENTNNRRSNKQLQNERNQRSQNAPQGYSQKSNSPRHKSQACTALFSGDTELTASEVYVPLDYAFPAKKICTPLCEEVSICWWISPYQFYTQLKSRTSDYERLLHDMQQFYKQKPLQQLQLKVDSYVIARYRKENVVLRARILACNHMLRKYKVFFVDVGNQYTVTSEDIWQVEQRFANFPCMAYRCSFAAIIANHDHLYIIDRMEKYLPEGAAIKCEYNEHVNDTYYVNVYVNNESLKESLKTAGFLTGISAELDVNLLAGQQVRAIVVSVKDMLNFKIRLEGCEDKVEFLCSYDDLRFVKSNAQLARRFKTFYEFSSCVFNIKEVNDNRVILLRPLLPLFKDDIPNIICTYPIILQHFQARVVYIASAYRLYVHLVSTDEQISILLDSMFIFYENGGSPLDKFEKDQICAAKSSDGNWYRARLTETEKFISRNPVEVLYIDYGNKEKVDKCMLKHLERQFYENMSAYGVEINLPIKPLKAATTEEATVKKEIESVLLETVVKIAAMEMRYNHLIAEVIFDDKNLVDVLKAKQLIKGRDLDYMRKQLNKDVPNVNEYIEMVDLTVEDEDDVYKCDKPKFSAKKQDLPKEAKQTADNVGIAETELATREPVVTAVEMIARAPAPSRSIDKADVFAEVSIKKPLTSAAKSPVESSKPVTPITMPNFCPHAEMERAVLSHCDNPAQFFIHPQDRVDKLHKLQETLQIVSPSLPQLMNVVNGADCISLYSVDKQWYRAKITDAELMALQFIDFGNTDCVSDTTDVKESMCSHMDQFCLPCALPIRPNGTADWTDAANAIFNDSYTKLLHYEYITRGDYQKKSYINLYIEGVNVGEKLIKDGFAKPLKLVTSGENCYICHVNGISDFYIQYEKDSKALELMEMYLIDAIDKLKPVEKFEQSKIVAALFVDDQMWYRAKLLHEIPNEGYEVRFIDYGNTSISPECRIMSEEIADLPALSKKCGLQLPPQCLGWTDNAEHRFAEIAASGETIFTVELQQPMADHALVHLHIDGVNLIDELAELCPKKTESAAKSELNSTIGNISLNNTTIYENGTRYDATISHVNSPLDFYVNVKKDLARLEDLTNTINTLSLEKYSTSLKVGQICAALFEDDNMLYRARVLEALPTVSNAEEAQNYRVFFIDYGNEAVTADLRALPQDLQQLKAYCKRCQLESSSKFTQYASLATETFNALIDNCAGLVKLEYIDSDADPALVKIFAANNDENICKQLHKLLENMQASRMKTSNTSISASTAVPNSNACLISHANSPELFYIQLMKNSVKLELLNKVLNDGNAVAFGMLKNAAIGDSCIAFSAEDECYYRGRVKSVLNKERAYEVFLIDHGNVIVCEELRELPIELGDIPALALPCKLDRIPTDVDARTLEEKFTALVELYFGEICDILSDEIDASSPDLHIVKLQVNYKDFGEELAKAIAGVTPSPVPQLYDCNIVEVKSATSFYLQLTQNISALEALTDKLLDAKEQFPTSTDLRVGGIYAAQFPEDQAFYRAEIVRDLGDGKYEVHYIDFGNNAITEHFRDIPPDLRNIQRYSKHCQLENGDVLNQFGSQFETFVDSHFSETFQLELLCTTTEPCVVRIFYQNKNVANEILSIVKLGDVSFECSSLAEGKCSNNAVGEINHPSGVRCANNDIPK